MIIIVQLIDLNAPILKAAILVNAMMDIQEMVIHATVSVEGWEGERVIRIK